MPRAGCIGQPVRAIVRITRPVARTSEQGVHLSSEITVPVDDVGMSEGEGWPSITMIKPDHVSTRTSRPASSSSRSLMSASTMSLTRSGVSTLGSQPSSRLAFE